MFIFMLVSSQCPPPSSRTSGSIWAVRLGWHWRCHWQWTSITFKTMVWGGGKWTWVTKVAGPSISYYAPGLRKAIRVFVGCQNHSLWPHFLEGKSFGYETKKAVGPVDLPRDIQVPLPLLYYLIWLGQWPFCPLVLSLGQQWGRLIFLPMPQLL